jgi:predicted nuclease of predicted toxin-antitoxin system
MRILCDEHVPPPLANAIRGEGLQVTTVGEALDHGASDDEVRANASEHGFVVLTNDSDFVARTDESGPDCGVLYYDDQRAPHRELVRAIRTVDDVLPDEQLVETTIFLPDGWT